jgi:CubicO group peptidase (beta-lactamase class C family)
MRAISFEGDMTTKARRAVRLTSVMGLTALGSTVSSAQSTSAPVPITVLVPRLDGIAQRFMRDAHVPGLVYGIVRGGRLEHAGTMGLQELEARRPVTASTLFRIASMSKAFTALAILKLRDEGKVTLDALAETYVPEMRGWKYPTNDSPRLRLRDLLSHAGGFVTDDPWGDRQQGLPEADFTRMVRDGVPFTRTPGISYEYSNFGYALLGRIMPTGPDDRTRTTSSRRSCAR